jgi:hypothetical protein
MTNYIRNPNLAVAQKMGGAARALQQKNEAWQRLMKYNENPNLCQYCKGPILAPLNNTRKTPLRETIIKKFCGFSCAAKYNNNRKGTGDGLKYCGRCKTARISTSRRFCRSCQKSNARQAGVFMVGVTKGELFARRKNWQSARSTIRYHAAYVYDRSGCPKACVAPNCGYSLYIEIAHKKGVSEFPDMTLITEINNIENLIPLCRRCHWEFDHGYLKL